MWKLRRCSQFSRQALYFVPTATNISEHGSGVLMRVAEPIGFEVELKTQQFSTILNIFSTILNNLEPHLLRCPDVLCSLRSTDLIAEIKY